MRAELRQLAQRRVLTRAERARRALRARADLCAAAALPLLAGVVVQLTCGYYTRQVRLPMTIVAAVVWLVGFGLVAARCRGLPHWRRALAIYHLAAVPAMLVNLVLVAAGWALAGGMCAGSGCSEGGFRGLHRVLSAIGQGIFDAVLLAMSLGSLLAIGWLVVRYDPMRWLKRLGADRLHALAEQLVDATPAAGGLGQTPPADQAPPASPPPPIDPTPDA